MKLEALTLNQTEGTARGFSAEMEQRVDDQVQNQARLHLETLDGKSGRWQGGLTLSGAGTQAGTTGDFTVNLPFRLTTDATPALKIPELRATVNLQPGKSLARALRLEAEGDVRAAWATSAAATPKAPEETASGNLLLRADESHLSLRWQLRALHPLDVRLVATLDKLDLDRYLNPAPADATLDAPPSSGMEAPEAKEGEALRLSGTVKVGEFRYQGVTVSGVAGELRWHDGKLEVRKPTPKKSRTPAAVSRKKRGKA
jgi:hypothetical protein